jgi:hypothetical protein
LKRCFAFAIYCDDWHFHKNSLSSYFKINSYEIIIAPVPIMQGYVDITKDPEWSSTKKKMSGASQVPQEEEYKIVMASNGYTPQSIAVSAGKGNWRWIDESKGIFEVILKDSETGEIN